MSLKSMTGFGQAEGVTPWGSCRVEIRGVNNRYLEIQLRQPKFLSPVELRIKQAITKAISRGSLAVGITCANEERAGALAWERDLVADYIRIFREMKEEFHLAGEVTLSDLLHFSDFIKVQSDRFDEEALWRQVEPLLNTALADYDRSREREGALLARDLMKMCRAVQTVTARVRKRSPQRLREYRRNLEKRIAELAGELADPARIAQETAIMADRLDIAEECSRMLIHTDALSATLSQKEPAGKRMNFLLQEMNREANTIGSKANDTAVAHLSIELKEIIERIREQIQNIE